MMHPSRQKILIIDDDQNFCDLLSVVLQEAGYLTQTAYTGKDGVEQFCKSPVDCILLDLNLPDTDGVAALKKIHQKMPELPVLMISGEGTIASAVAATKEGAFDFLEKPLDNDRMLLTINHALKTGELEKDRARLLENVRNRSVMIGQSPPMERIRSLIQKAALTNSKVLIYGDNGTGKELVARAIHNYSKRVSMPFVAVNCAAIPETLIESELFGHRKGSFTGAVGDKKGRFQLAEGGTIFLDEIGDMSPGTQSKVLRVLEQGTIEMVGGGIPVPVDVRVIAATNKNLQQEMQQGKFREDLYFRLNVLTIHLPPLHERQEDIGRLADYFIEQACTEYGVPVKRLAPGASRILSEHSWPGNVRELKNFIEKLVVLIEAETIGKKELSYLLQSHQSSTPRMKRDITLRQAKAAFEREFIHEKLMSTNGNVTKAAKLLDIPRTYLHKKIKQLKIAY